MQQRLNDSAKLTAFAQRTCKTTRTVQPAASSSSSGSSSGFAITFFNYTTRHTRAPKRPHARGAPEPRDLCACACAEQMSSCARARACVLIFLYVALCARRNGAHITHNVDAARHHVKRNIVRKVHTVHRILCIALGADKSLRALGVCMLSVSRWKNSPIFPAARQSLARCMAPPISPSSAQLTCTR